MWFYAFYDIEASFLVYFSSKPVFPLFLRFPEKVLDPNGPHTNTFQTIPNKKCLSVCLSIVVYTSLCRGMKYLLKVLFSKIILTWPDF